MGGSIVTHTPDILWVFNTDSERTVVYRWPEHEKPCGPMNHHHYPTGSNEDTRSCRLRLRTPVVRVSLATVRVRNSLQLRTRWWVGGLLISVSGVPFMEFISNEASRTEMGYLPVYDTTCSFLLERTAFTAEQINEGLGHTTGTPILTV